MQLIVCVRDTPLLQHVPQVDAKVMKLSFSEEAAGDPSIYSKIVCVCVCACSSSYQNAV